MNKTNTPSHHCHQVKSQRSIDLITMGCSKNLVDSERLLRRFADAGCRVFHNPETIHGDIAVVNTCGFIGDAKEESINMILSLADAKEDGDLKEIYVMGCLSERYRKELAEEIPQVDRFYGKFDWDGLIADLRLTPAACPTADDRLLTTPGHYAYIKIAEGCNRRCAYCAIPLITGPQVSRPMEDILAEMEALVSKGVSEFQIIAQDLTGYGTDLYGEQRIAELIDRMAVIPGVRWIRLHYAYPEQFPMALLDVMNRYDNVCKYLDIALQHISDDILRRMHRASTKASTLAVIKAIRERVPGICLRTTMMVGFPGETEKEYDELLDFVRTARFERLGGFAYSEEEGTYAAKHYADDIPEEVKQKRLDRLMDLQQDIMAACQEQLVGRTLPVVIDRREGDYYVGRTAYDSPEVDPETLIEASAGELETGKFYMVHIDRSDIYELYGTVVGPAD
ncbi:MAG: 30S ribosomal protein S12 methylthiotransferase RimO [Bacteroidales bacterium]|nr:30S ribosomal protein S12 methylthiotransferase RimO [Bacteroidales bacterium]